MWGHLSEGCPDLEGVVESLQIFVTGDFDGAESGGIRRNHLDIEQSIASILQVFHQGNEGDFGGVWFDSEHRFRCKESVDGDSIDAADQSVVKPSFDAVCESEFVEQGECPVKTGSYPRGSVPIRGLSTSSQDAAKILIACDPKASVSTDSSESFWDVNRFEFDDSAWVQ